MESDKLSAEELEADKSSSTEGPDSPGLSPSSSPPVPRYSINFTDNVSKDGDVIQYTINVRKLNEDSGENIRRHPVPRPPACRAQQASWDHIPEPACETS